MLELKLEYQSIGQPMLGGRRLLLVLEKGSTTEAYLELLSSCPTSLPSTRTTNVPCHSQQES